MIKVLKLSQLSWLQTRLYNGITEKVIKAVSKFTDEL